jgi:hypothetical protein
VRLQAPARLLPARKKYRVMLPFMAEAFQAGDKLVHIIDKSLTQHRRRDRQANRPNSKSCAGSTHVVAGYFDIGAGCLPIWTGELPSNERYEVAPVV